MQSYTRIKLIRVTLLWGDRFWQRETTFGSQKWSDRTDFGSKSGPGDQFWQVFSAKIGPAGPILGGTDFGVTGLRLLCSKIYHLFIPEFLKIFTYYS